MRYQCENSERYDLPENDPELCRSMGVPTIGTADASDIPDPDCTKKAVPRLALSYMLSQPWEDILEPENALRAGTVFRALALPFTGSRKNPGMTGGLRHE